MADCDLLLTNGRLATMASDGIGAIEPGAIAITGDRISFAGPSAFLPRSSAAETIDLGGRWVTPGLIDCHTHLVYAGNRAREFALRLGGASYREIAAAGGGIQSSVVATRAASEDALYETAVARLSALLAEGVTTVEIKSGYGLDRDTELRMLRVARRLGQNLPVSVVATYLGGHTPPPEYASDRAGYVALVENVMAEALADGLCDAIDICYDPIGFDRDECEKMLTAAQRLGLPAKLHTGQFASQGGGRLAAEYHALSADHVEHLSEDDVEAMAAAGTVAVVLPGAFYYLRETQKPPIALLRSAGVPIAVATDHNPGSSPLLSLVLAMNMASVFFGLTPFETLAAVTRNAAKALGVLGDRGTIEAGKRADLAIWSVGDPGELAAGIGGRTATVVIRNGRIVADRRFAGEGPL